jgi:hypothetical protein
MARPQGNKLQAEEYYLGRWYDPSIVNVLHDFDNGKDFTFADAADNFSIYALQADADSRIQLDRGATMGARQQIQFQFLAAAGVSTTCVFVNPTSHNIVITDISEIHSAAGTDAGAVTAVITHETAAGQAPGAGSSVMTNTFNFKGAANTLQRATLAAVDGLGRVNTVLIVKPGERLSLQVTGVVTALAGVVVTLSVAPGTKESLALYSIKANGSLATQGIFLANRDLVAQGVWMVWSTAGTDAGAVTVDLTIENVNSGTPAPGTGASILAAAQNVKLTANTPANVPLSGTAANLLMRAGNRLSVKFTGTLTALAGVVVAVSLGPTGGVTGALGELDINFSIQANASNLTQGVFVADQDYVLVDGSFVVSTASAAGTITFTIDKGVVAPGAGTAMLNAALATTTANTVGVGVLNVSRRTRMISRGDLVSVLLATPGAEAGLVASLSLQKA